LTDTAASASAILLQLHSHLPALQVPDEEKRRRADYVIDTGCSLQETQQQVVSILQELTGRQGTAAARLLAHKSDGQQQAD
jgi:hypothetical protein